MIQIQGKITRTELLANDLDGQIAAGCEQFQQRQATFVRLRDETLPRYQVLAADPEVKAALAELNKTSKPKVALGPLQRYQLNVAKSAVESS